MSNRAKIFLSGGFRTNWQTKVIAPLYEKFIFYNPLDHALGNSSEYTAWDLFYVKKCDIVFAYMEASNPSGYGLMLEIGLAHGLGKTIVLVDEKSDADEEFGRYFKMAHHVADVTFNNLTDGINYLSKFY